MNFFDRTILLCYCLVMLQSNISDVYSLKYTKIKINSDDDLSLENSLNMQNLLILIKSVFIKITNIIMRSF